MEISLILLCFSREEHEEKQNTKGTVITGFNEHFFCPEIVPLFAYTLLRMTTFTLIFSFVAFCKVQSFQVKTVESAKTDDPRDSDEYDDFYD